MDKFIKQAVVFAGAAVSVALFFAETPVHADVPGWNWFSTYGFGAETNPSPSAMGSGASYHNAYQGNGALNIFTGSFDTEVSVNAPPDNTPNGPSLNAQNGFGSDIHVYAHYYSPNNAGPPKGSGVELTSTFVWIAGADAAASYTTQNNNWVANNGTAHASTTVQINGGSVVPTDSSVGIGDPIEAKSPIPLSYGAAFSQSTNTSASAGDVTLSGSNTGWQGRGGVELFQNGSLVYGNQMDGAVGYWTGKISVPNVNYIWGAYEAHNHIDITTQASAFNGSCASGYGFVSAFFIGSPAN